MYNLTDYSVIFLSFFLLSACTMHEFMEICAHGANSNAESNLLKKVGNLFVYLFVINDVR